MLGDFRALAAEIFNYAGLTTGRASESSSPGRCPPNALFLDDAIESGFSRMDHSIEICVRERAVARLSGHERAPTCGRTQRTAELHGVGLARHAIPNQVEAARLRPKIC